MNRLFPFLNRSPGNQPQAVGEEEEKEEEEEEVAPVPPGPVLPHRANPRHGKTGANYESPTVDLVQDTLRLECGMVAGKGNIRWTCPACSASGSNITRLHEHMLNTHSRNKKLMTLTCLSVGEYSRGGNKLELEAKLRKTMGDTPAEPNPLLEMASFNAERQLKICLASAVVEGNLPFSMCEQDWAYDLVDLGIMMGVKAKTDNPRLHQAPIGRKLRISRPTLTGSVDQLCGELIATHLDAVRKEAQVRGCTQVSDGRSNIKNDGLLVYGVVAGQTFFPQGAHNAGDNKKDASYLRKVAKSYLDADDCLGDDTFANVSDGARACLNSLDMLEMFEFLVRSRCQSHAVSLFLKAVATKVGPFPGFIEDATKLIDFIRSRPRVNSILKRKSAGCSVVRFVPTRFGTHVIGAGRLLKLRQAIMDIFSDPVYLNEYKAKQTAKVQLEVFAPVERISRDTEFWNGLEFFYNLLIPALMALRLMDSSSVRAKDIIPIWENLEGKMIVALMDPRFASFDTEVKIAVLKQYVDTRTDAHRPVFDAAWVLDPSNRQRVQELASGRCSAGERRTWASRRENTLNVLRVMAKRKMLIEQKKAFRAASSSTQSAKRVRVGDEAAIEFELDEERHAAASQQEFEEIRNEFFAYISGTGCFSSSGLSSFSSIEESYWCANGSSLNFYAIRILNMAATISDVERLHKVYAGIHTPSRNRLSDCRVDRLALARIASRVFSLDKKPFITQLKSFTAFSEAEEQLLVDWSQLQSNAISQLARTIQEPTADGSIRLDSPVIDPAQVQDGAAQGSTSASVARAVAETDSESDVLLDILNVEEVDERDEDEAVFSGSSSRAETDQNVQFSGAVLASPLFLALFT
jgi:hypothetical protein